MNNKTIPKIVSLLFIIRWPLVIPFIRKFIKYLVPNLKNTDFIHGFECQFGNIVCEKNVFLSDTIFIDHVPVYIGEGTKFTRRNIVITGDHKNGLNGETSLKEVHIGKNCWITTNVTILSGVSIGENTIIGAGSVVTKDIPANCIAAGNPCKVLKYI